MKNTCALLCVFLLVGAALGNDDDLPSNEGINGVRVVPHHKSLTESNVKQISIIAGDHDKLSVGEVAGVQMGLAPNGAQNAGGVFSLGNVELTPRVQSSVPMTGFHDPGSVQHIGKELNIAPVATQKVVVHKGLATGDASIPIVLHPNHPNLVVLRAWVNVQSATACEDRCRADHDCLVSDYGSKTTGTRDSTDYVANDQTCILFAMRNKVSCSFTANIPNPLS
jgi:hypothetical protein